MNGTKVGEHAGEIKRVPLFRVSTQVVTGFYYNDQCSRASWCSASCPLLLLT